jgi:hypothetical protein
MKMQQMMEHPLAKMDTNQAKIKAMQQWRNSVFDVVHAEELS